MRLRQLLLTELSRPSSMQHAKAVLIDAGWAKLGQGAFATVFGREDKDYVVKIFDDPGYLHYLNLILKNPNQHFPVIKGKPTKINLKTWAVRLERLESLKGSNVQLGEHAASYLMGFIHLAEAEQELFIGYSGGSNELPHWGQTWRSPNDPRLNYEPVARMRQELMSFEQHYSSLAEALRMVATEILIPNHISADLHQHNCMQRGVTLVITDPIAHDFDTPEILPRTRSPQLELPMAKQSASWQHGYGSDYRELSNRLPLPTRNIPDPFYEPTIPGTDPFDKKSIMARRRRERQHDSPVF